MATQDPVIGFTDDGWPIHLPYEARRGHTYMVGISGMGKSTALARLALADATHPDRHGLCVIDPHGELVDDILCRIPDWRAEDVILIDPTDTDYPVALNPFAPLPDPTELDRFASDLMAVLGRAVGPKLDEVADAVRSANLTLLARRMTAETGPRSVMPALDELPDLFSLEQPVPGDERKRPWDQRITTYRSFFYDDVLEAGLIPVFQYWTGTYDKLTPRPKVDLISSVGEVVNRFLTNPLMARIVGQSENKLDLNEVVNSGKILLVRLPKTDLGEENLFFLGTMLLARITSAVFARGLRLGATRSPFHLYVDEFQNFTSSAFPTLLAEARKFDVDLVLAHQSRNDLDPAIKSATSARNIWCFELRGDDHLDMAWQFDIEPPDALPSYRPVYIDETEDASAERSTVEVEPPRVPKPPQAPDPIPDDVLRWAKFLEHVPEPDAVGRVALTGAQFHDLFPALYESTKDDPVYAPLVRECLMDWSAGPWLHEHDYRTGFDYMYRHRREPFIRNFPPGDEIITILGERVDWPVTAEQDASYVQQYEAKFGRYARLLGRILGRDFRVKIASAIEGHPRKVQLHKDERRRYDERLLEINEDFRTVTTPPRMESIETLVSIPEAAAAAPVVADPAALRSSNSRPTPAMRTRRSFRSTASRRVRATGESQSGSTSRGLTPAGETQSASDSWSATASVGISEDLGIYEEVPGRPRPYSDVHLEIANMLSHLGPHRAMVRITEAREASNNVIHTLNLGPATLSPEVIRGIRERSQMEYCRPRAEVEAEIRARFEARQLSVRNLNVADHALRTPYESDDL